MPVQPTSLAARRPPVLWGHRGIALYLDTTRKRVERLIEVDGLPAFKVGARVCARPDDLDRWLAERAAQPEHADAS
jgi:excisionase family DNA binding protein